MDMLKPFENQKYLNLETFRKNGQAMPSPVWFVQDGEIIYIRTAANSGKVKRVRANPRVNLMPCGVDGEPLGAWTRRLPTKPAMKPFLRAFANCCWKSMAAW